MPKTLGLHFASQAAASSANECKHAILGEIQTAHGVVKTPAFFFCATKGALKAVNIADARNLGIQLILCNTYHLMLRPGAEQVRRFGGLQNFTDWQGPMFTDSGGFQIFSMGHSGSVADEIKRRQKNSRLNAASLVKISEEGACFRSYVDGAKVFLSPELCMDIQYSLGADLIVQLDECTPFHVPKDYTAKAMRRSLRWAKLSHRRFLELANENNLDGKAKNLIGNTENPLSFAESENPSKNLFKSDMPYNRGLYGVVQGGVYADLRRESLEGLAEIPFFGLAIGGSLGQSQSEMMDVIEMTMDLLRNIYSKKWMRMPVHLLGIGDRKSIFHGLRQGISSFDCVSPTRIARHGHALVKTSQSLDGQSEKINLWNAAFKDDDRALDKTSPHSVSQKHSRAYIHYLLKAGELSALSILSMHNIAQMTRLMADIRLALKKGSLPETERDWCATA